MNATPWKVAVVGGGSAAWMTAAALARALRHRAVQVTVIDNGASDSAAGEWTLPSTRAMHQLLGIREGDFLRDTGASFRLGTEHLGWQGEGSVFAHAHGSIGKELHGIPFYKLILARRILGDAMPADAFSLAAAALKRGRFARPEGEDQSMTASFTYGYHLPLAPYAALLRALALASGVQIVTGSIESLQREAGNLQSITLGGGRKIDARVFVDCTGPEASLISQMPDTGRCDWSANLPCDRMISGIGPVLPADRAATETRATAAGWLWRAPLAGASLGGFVYQSSLLSDDAAREQLRQVCGVGDPIVSPLHGGRRRNFWVGNVIAVGESAMQLEPLVGATLHFVQLGIGTLIEVFPLDAATVGEAQEYNRIMGEHADALRDFTCAHYLCATRSGALWEQARAAPVPERLAGRMELYKAAGRILEFDHETFEEIDWAWLYLGSGLLPDALEARTASRVARVTSIEAGEIADQVRGLAESMPPHQAYLNHVSQLRAR